MKCRRGRAPSTTPPPVDPLIDMILQQQDNLIIHEAGRNRSLVAKQNVPNIYNLLLLSYKPQVDRLSVVVRLVFNV